MKKLFSLILVAAMLLTSVAALAETIDTSTLSGDEKAAALGIHHGDGGGQRHKGFAKFVHQMFIDQGCKLLSSQFNYILL